MKISGASLITSAFRAYDVRGLVGTEVTEDLVERVGSAVGSCFYHGTVTMGRDTRTSGPVLQERLQSGLLKAGCNVQSYGVIPISVLSFLTWKDKINAATYISASHNPPEYNGVRFRTSDGNGMLYKKTKIMDFYQSGEFTRGEGRISEQDPQLAIKRYAEYMSKKLNFKRSLKIVLDFGNGSACSMGQVYESLGLKAIPVNDIMDGNFPGRGPGPTEESLRGACSIVVKEKADYGVGFDPDADRGLIIDDLGRVIPPEKIAIIIAKEKYNKNDLIIAGFDCSMIVERQLEPMGFVVKRERVGDVFIANRVKDSGAVLGVERSAHFFLPEFQFSDDPFAMSLALGEIISRGERLSDLVDQIPDYPYRQKSIHIKGDLANIMSRIERRLRDDQTEMKLDTLDGLKISTDAYSILIRPSNTEPILRLYIETAGKDMEELEEHYENLIKQSMQA